MKVVIVGGIAAGLSAASQIRRLAPTAEVVVLEKGGDVSYSACGMPYNLYCRESPVEELHALSYDTIRSGRGVDYRLRSEVIAIHPQRQEVAVRDLETGKEYDEGYDHLVYATGNRPVRLNLPGFTDDTVFLFRNLDEARRLKAFIRLRSPRCAVLVGAGYTNLELSDVLTNLKIKTVILDKSTHLLPVFCDGVREKVLEKMTEKGLELHTGVEVREKAGAMVRSSAGDFPADLVIAAIGVRPCTGLLAAAGGELGVCGAARVDRYLRTTLPHVFAAGDCAEHYVRPLGRNGYLPLGPVANKQGRLVGYNIANPRKMREFPGIDQTAVFKFFDLTVATTGLNERQLAAEDKPYITVAVDTETRGGFPGGGRMRVVLFCAPGSGLLLGAQMVGQDVVAKRIDVLATAVYAGMTVFQVAELDLSYAPPFAPVWDPILVAANQAVKVV